MAAADEALEKAMDKKGWQHAGVWLTGTKAFVILDNQKQVKKTQATSVQKEFGGKVFVNAVASVSGSSVEFRFPSSESSIPGKVHLKTGMMEQLGDDAKVKVSIGPSLDAYPKKLGDVR